VAVPRRSYPPRLPAAVVLTLPETLPFAWASAAHQEPAASPRWLAGSARTENDLESGVTMATVEECRMALERLTARISEMDAKDREHHLLDRTLSCRVPDLGVTYLTRLGPHGADPVQQVNDGRTAAQVRFTARSDVVVSVAEDPGSFVRAWLSGRLKIEGNFFDLLHLRRLI